MRWSTPLLGVVLAAGSLLGFACSGGPSATNSTNETSDCEEGSEGCACVLESTCDPGLICASKMCVPSGQTTDATESSTTESMTGTASSTTEMTSDTGGECSPPDGSANQYCVGQDPGRPYCNAAGSCVDCTGLAACGVDAPVCDPNSGVCVLCIPGDDEACVGQTPVCDPGTLSCVACEAHDECGDGACNLFTGECLAEEAAIWVDNSNPDCASDGGTEATPYCTLGEAMVEVVQGILGDEAVIHVGGGPYESTITVPSGRKVAIRSLDAGKRVAIGAADGAIITVEPGSTALLDGLVLTGNGIGDGLVVDNAFLWIDRTEIADNSGYGIFAKASQVKTRGLVVTKNADGGIVANAGAFHFENSFATANSTDENDFGAFNVLGGADLQVLYSTVVANNTIIGDPGSLRCAGDVGAVKIRNSILVAGNSTIDCPSASISHSVLDTPSNDPSNLMWSFDGISEILTSDGGVYRAKAGTALADVGLWVDGDPQGDFEGDARPEEESADYAGADVP
ncbi:MAG: hypothetical protein R3A79_25795 [Nannocystaceae bacterium]